MYISPISMNYNYAKKYNVCSTPSMKGIKPAVKTSEKNKISDKFQKFFKNYIMGYPKRINYTWQHKKAFLKVEKDLCGKNSLQGYLHDADKLIMYIIGVPKETAHNIHVATSPHHIRNGHIKSPLMAVIDWECARYTKPDKPLSAREFYEKKCPKMSEIEEILDRFGL